MSKVIARHSVYLLNFRKLLRVAFRQPGGGYEVTVEKIRELIETGASAWPPGGAIRRLLLQLVQEYRSEKDAANKIRYS